MESTLLTSVPYTPRPPRKVFRYSDTRIKFASDLESQLHFYLHGQGNRNRLVPSALPETAASMVVTAMAVGAAATLLVRRTRASSETMTDSSMRECEDCGGSGICAECKGEGFVLKKLSDESAARARMLAKDMATRYTAGLPKKWSYCTKCSSSRSCRTCGGTGKISWHGASSGILLGTVNPPTVLLSWLIQTSRALETHDVGSEGSYVAMNLVWLLFHGLASCNSVTYPVYPSDFPILCLNG